MSLEIVKSALSTARNIPTGMSVDAWIKNEDIRAERVFKYRQYADGEHASNMTPEMRKLLRLPPTSSALEFNDNYCDIIIQAMADRLSVTAMDADNEAAAAWAADTMSRTRFDGLQMDVTEAAIRDGDAYVMVSIDRETKKARFTYEPAYDGMNGMIVLYESFSAPRPMLAVKVWQMMPDASEEGRTTVRVNVYYQNRIERFISVNGGSLEAYTTEDAEFVQPLTMDGLQTGEAIGLPIVHFKNRRASYDNHGLSELNNAIPLQDALNRNLYSMVIASELTAFRIGIARGFIPPAALVPGMIMVVNGGKDISKDEVVDFEVVDGADLSQYIAIAQHYTSEMGKVTRTPSPEFMGGDNSSGEALKQRESGMLGKVRRFQVSGGNAWEDAFMIAHRMETAYSTTTPAPVTSFTTQWRDPNIRNDKERIEMVQMIADKLDDRTLLELVAQVYDFDKDKIDEILAAKESEADANVRRFGNQLQNFDSFDQGLEPAAAQPPNGNGNLQENTTNG